MRCDRLWRNARLATLVPPGLGMVEHGLVACAEGKILYAGQEADAPAFQGDMIDCEGRWITPGLIDCHTHLVYGGNRIQEFEQRLGGASYAELAKSGGGILSTMRATQKASQEELVESALPRLDALLAEGVTTIEIKSGYGLALEHEIKQLRTAKDLGHARPVTVESTYLAAHALPPDFAGDADRYITDVCEIMIPAVAKTGLASAVDAFCETVAFSPDQIRKVLQAAKAHGFAVKLHAEQLSNQNAAALAAEFGALSADHLEHLDKEGAAAMAAASTVAVLLPGAYYFTHETQPPPIALLRQLGVPIALASDCNPGTSPLTSPLLVMNMGATLFQLTVAECIAGITREAARALGLADQIGTLQAGKSCDLAIWDIEHPAELVYHIGLNPLQARVWRGQ